MGPMRILAPTLAIALFSTPWPALAQHATSNAGSSSGAAASAFSGGTTNNFMGSRIPTPVPDVLAPGLTAGANACVQSWSVGVGFAGTGIGGGSTYKDDECNDQKWFVLFSQAAHTGGINPQAAYQYDWWARSMACLDPRLRAAAPPGVCSPAPAEAVAPAPVASVAPAYAAPSPLAIPDYCYTASRSELRRHPECRGHGDP